MDSPTAVYGAQVYVRSTAADIILDAQTGQSNIQMYALSQVNFVSNVVYLYDANPLTGSTPTSVEVHNGSTVVMNQNLSVEQNIQVGGGVSTLGSVSAAGGVGTPGGGEMGIIRTADINRMRTSINGASKNANDSQVLYLAALKSTTGPYAKSNSLGQESVISTIQFSFRTDAQYGLDFVDPEDNKLIFICQFRWQQLFAANGNTSNWKESSVSTHLGETMPFPGYMNWTSNELLGKVDLSFWSMKDGEVQDLSQYQPQTNVMTMTTMQSGYIVNL